MTPYNDGYKYLIQFISFKTYDRINGNWKHNWINFVCEHHSCWSELAVTQFSMLCQHYIHLQKTRWLMSQFVSHNKKSVLSLKFWSNFFPYQDYVQREGIIITILRRFGKSDSTFYGNLQRRSRWGCRSKNVYPHLLWRPLSPSSTLAGAEFKNEAPENRYDYTLPCAKASKKVWRKKSLSKWSLMRCRCLSEKAKKKYLVSGDYTIAFRS